MMDRLTYRDKNRDAFIKPINPGSFLCEDCGSHGVRCTNHHRQLIERLAAYEDSGLTPECAQELGKADAEGRIVVLPSIKLYKTLYWIWGNEIMPVKYMGIHGGCVAKGVYHITCDMKTKRDRTFNHGGKPFTYKAGDARMFYADDIGKTVFLTREEAVAALAKLKEAEHEVD